MAYDTIRLRSPYLDRQLVAKIEQQCFLRSGQDMSTGEIKYEIFTGELLGSWDSRISVIPKYDEYVLDKNGIPRCSPCEPYIFIEASVHKVFLGHNVYGGPTDFQKVCSEFVCLIEELLCPDALPSPKDWTVHRVDVAHVYRLPKAACLEFFDGLQLSSFPRRKKGTSKYATAFHSAGRTTTIKLYHKGSEFSAHELPRLREYFRSLFQHMYGIETDIKKLVQRKIEALQRLADNRLRVEVGINSDKFKYDFDRHPRVDEITDAYLEQIFDKEVERLLREGKQAMDTVRDSRAVMHRLKNIYGPNSGMRLYGFWTSMTTMGDEVTREQFSKTVFFRNRKLLEDAGVSWLGTDIKVIANDRLVPHDFSPVRTDKRLCFLPARNRPEFHVSRETMRLAA